MKVPFALTVSKAPEGNVVAVPNGTAVPLELVTVATDRVAPVFGSVSLVNKLLVVSGVPSVVPKESLTATGF